MSDTSPMPFVLSLSKGEWHASSVRSWFDWLTTNGNTEVSCFYGTQRA
jgi:hypothetical protein